MSGKAQQSPHALGQAAFIICSPDLRTVRAFADEIEDHLAAQGIAARICLYGVGMKRHDGFLVVESAGGIPPAFIRWLGDDEDILDFVVYDVASSEQERG
jgi:hypothetical protein